MTSKNLVLSPRLEKIYNLLPTECVMADIGTDHGYLPTYAILKGKAKSAILADINEGPLAKAHETVEAYGVTDKTDLRLCDGLSDLKKEEADTIVIAGMGGETIAHIVNSCNWVKDKEKNYFFQPMSKIPTLREYLYENGFCIEHEELVEEIDKIYVVMAVKYDGVKRKYTQSDLYLGKAFLLETDLVLDYVKKVRKDVSNRLKGSISDQLKAEYEEIIQKIDYCVINNDKVEDNGNEN